MLEHAREITRELVGIARNRAIPIANRLIGEEDGRQSAHTVHLSRNARVGDGGLQTRLKTRAQKLKIVVNPLTSSLRIHRSGNDARLQRSQLSQAGLHGNGIAGKRARLVHRAVRGKLIHDLGATGKAANGETAANDLAERAQVGHDAVTLLRTAKGNAETGDNLVEDQKRAELIAQVAQAL